MELKDTPWYMAIVASIVKVWKAYYCHLVFSFTNRSYSYECPAEISNGLYIFFGSFLCGLITLAIYKECKKMYGNRAEMINTTSRSGGPTIITQQQQQHAPQPIKNGVPPAPWANYPQPQENTPPKY